MPCYVFSLLVILYITGCAFANLEYSRLVVLGWYEIIFKCIVEGCRHFAHLRKGLLHCAGIVCRCFTFVLGGSEATHL
jgi:hypothetical protein